MKMDRQTQARQIRKPLAAPYFTLGSVDALTVDGILDIASATAIRLARTPPRLVS